MDGLAEEIRGTNTQKLAAKITELVVSYNAKRHLERIRLLLNSAMFRVHGLPSEHHCKGLLQRSGIWSIQSLYCSQQVELY
ncbi:hypothetical protein [uncultured Alistipes sp.]|uniref:hypothetical protein n=1 Tax=uncultured Alistipes sp. TaxID=538949 RepID=UPI00258905B7|nr:hypothetical protein [uncultured Alistipes sp.]